MATECNDNAPSKRVISGEENMLIDMSNPEEFQKAFIASEILNRKY